MFVDIRFRKAVSFLYADRHDPRKHFDGEVERLPIGTVFFIVKSLDDSDEGATEITSHLQYSRSVIYAVTARHVLENDAQIFIRFNTTDGYYEDSLTVRSDWVDHPSVDDTDVSVCCITDIVTESAPNKIADVKWIPFTMLATKSHVAGIPEEILTGYDVFIYGLFTSFPGEDHTAPLVRFGNVSLIPNEKVEAELTDKEGNRDLKLIDAYLIEARSMGGLSGAPVLFYYPALQGGLTGGGELLMSGLQVPTILGLIQGQYEFEYQLKRVINAGISLVVPASKIRETIMQQRLKDERAAKV